MERLTKTCSDGTHRAADILPCGENSWDYKELLLERLGAYEDTGLTPWQMVEIDRLYIQMCGDLAEMKKRARWIPVSDCLPKPGDTVLAYIKHNYAEDGWRAFQVYKFTDHWVGIGNLCEVIAWMPLPEPYRPEDAK